MSSSTWTRITLIALTACVVAALAAPAQGATLRRDGSKAVPFVAVVAPEAGDSHNGPALRRDGSKAVPVVADLDPQPTAEADGFDWGTAGIGAGIGALAAVLAGVAVISVRGRHQGRRPALRPRELG